MPMISVTPSYLEGLAKHQDEAAATFTAAASAVSGMADKVLDTHGAICDTAESRRSLRNAEEAHKNLAYAMQNYAKDLAGWLRQAAYAYESADDIAAQNLRRQIM